MSAFLPEAIRIAATGAGVALAGLALSFAAIVPAAAAGPEAELKRVERALGEAAEKKTALEREAGDLESEITELRRRSVRVAARAQRFEAEITELEQRAESFDTEEAAKSASLRRRRVQLATMLAALQRISRHPPAALIAMPTSPVDMLRSALLLRAAVPELEMQAIALRHELSALAGVRRRISQTRTRMARATVALDAERDRLDVLLEGKARLAVRRRAESREARERMAKLAAEASDLQDLLKRLAESRRSAPPVLLALALPRPPALPPNARPDSGRPWLPVSGRVVRAFGQKDGAGNLSKGITIAARQAAQVVAPKSGTVVFAGPFRGFGQLLIIEHAKGYHTLLAGLGRIDAEVGEKVLGGEPVGVLAASRQDKPALYVELRRRGRPINPLPWLAAGRIKVNG